jgi:hypothetical protein
MQTGGASLGQAVEESFNLFNRVQFGNQRGTLSRTECELYKALPHFVAARP